ncbi:MULTISPECIES: uroporphyrinogen-III C-methyltransferase [Citricoccus]|uniref:uroporphyrinogen-III C-methyltransferase n=1 Tax=Citricoccus TaxID=169133 RepID=UPI000255F168|nr:uroporphyrinogen-III C-methyltransferase [Citricoccus sp. CH26A]
MTGAVPAPGSVALIGAGPGAGDLLTVRALRVLSHADVVYFDRLAPTDDLAAWAPHAHLVDVGKQPGHHRVTQAEINRLIVASALAGLRVARLKGGDPFVFGRGSEEVAACEEAGVPVTVVPGITSAVAAPAAAGIPVTARGLSKAFTVISGHDPLSELELSGLARLGGTAVVLMGMATLGHTATGLMRHGVDPRMPVGIVERGCTERQRVCVAPLAEILTASAVQGMRSPAVLVIGEVVRLAPGAEERLRELAGVAGTA